MKSLLNAMKQAASRTDAQFGQSLNPLSVASANEGVVHFNNQVSILYVEDNLFNQTICMKVLKNLGCRCEIANSGMEAIDLLSAKRYDIILMDINMPVLDGLETTKQIREKLKLQVPVIAVTTNCLDEDIENCKQAGINDHLGKPYSPQQLSSLIFKWCGISGVKY